MSSESTEIVRIGAGSFATVYVWQSRNSVALKRVANPAKKKVLETEFADLQLLHSCERSPVLFSFPKAIGYYASYGAFCEEMDIPVEPEEELNKTNLYLMERVWPLPPKMASTVRRDFFPEQFASNRQAFLARIYLGKEDDSGKHSRFFNPNNFPLYPKRLEALNLPFTTEDIAKEMGRLLSQIHYTARRDGRDIEFVLGGHPENPLLQPSLYCIDFNQMKPWSSTEKLVESYLQNDPYYPRPGQEYWACFRDGYVQEAVGTVQDRLVAEEFLELLQQKFA